MYWLFDFLPKEPGKRFIISLCVCETNQNMEFQRIFKWRNMALSIEWNGYISFWSSQEITLMIHCTAFKLAMIHTQKRIRGRLLIPLDFYGGGKGFWKRKKSYIYFYKKYHLKNSNKGAKLHSHLSQFGRPCICFPKTISCIFCKTIYPHQSFTLPTNLMGYPFRLQII